MGDYDRAIANFDTTIKLNPKDVGAYYNRGLAHEISEQRDKAITDYRMALELDPSIKESLDGLKRLGVTP